ncbi:MAG: ParB/RepB/Spo0J family partition protein [Halothiobacillaceae bacterium]
MSTKRKGLGKGLEQLLSVSAQRADGPELREVSLELIRRNPFQPRLTFDETALAELADSIRAQGVIQPVVLRRRSGEYELIAGERRWRAAQLAGLERVPAVVRDIDDAQAAAIALIENLQRENLNPVEQAQAMNRLVEEFALTHQQVADMLGTSRPAVSNALRLLELAPEVQDLLRARRLDMGHARALLPLSRADQSALAERIVARALTVRQVERMVHRHQSGPDSSSPSAEPDADTQRLERLLSETTGLAARIRAGKRGRGTVTLSFDSLDQLDGFLSRLR